MRAICQPLDADCPGCAMPVSQEDARAISRSIREDKVCCRCSKDVSQLERDRQRKAA